MATYNWVSPTSDNGQQAGWQNGSNARDNNTASSASYCYEISDYGAFIEFEYAGGLLCDKIRFYAAQDYGSTIDIDVYRPGSGWLPVYDGSFAWDVFTVKTIPGGAKFITKARVRFWEEGGATVYLKEFYFNKLKNRPLVGQSLAGGRRGLV